jgi:hypothetical protein
MISYDEFKRLDVNHKTHGSQRNNTPENLELITHKANLAHARTNPTRKSCAKALSKPILGKRKCDATWTEFASAREAERVLTKQEGKVFDESSITAVCKKRAKSHHGYEFQYNEQPDLDGEVWKWNPFLKVQCSNLGRVETIFSIKTFGSPSGEYLVVGIRGKKYQVHRVIAQAFHWDAVQQLYSQQTECTDIMGFWKKLHVDHLNFDKRDNRATNLVPTTAKVNIARQPLNKKSCAAALSKPIEGRKLGESEWVTYPSVTKAARVLGLDSGNISKVCRGKYKRTGDYTFRFVDDPGLEGEIWKPIPKALFPGKNVNGMKASNKGRILTPKGIKTYGSPSGKYLRCCGLYVHRLVAAAFLCGY